MCSGCENLHLEDKFGSRVEITHVELIEDLSEAGEGQLVFFIRVAQTKEPLCQDHRQVAIFCEGDFVYCNCLECLLFDAP